MMRFIYLVAMTFFIKGKQVQVIAETQPRVVSRPFDGWKHPAKKAFCHDPGKHG